MDDAAQAAAYSDADFAESHQRFADEAAGRFAELRAGTGTLVDVGCGPADATVRLARACPGWSVVGVDGAAEMLRHARARITGAGLEGRVRVEQVRLPSATLGARRFDALVSNSLLHHLADPAVLWDLAAACLAPGAPVVVMDLCRPEAAADVGRLVDRYAADAPAVLREDFANSLRAAYRPGEVAAQLDTAGLDDLAVEMVTDRHLLVAGRR
jgi:cyclopropane fatty-acyl-phospholipid synthase-like methyltransferase